MKIFRWLFISLVFFIAVSAYAEKLDSEERIISFVSDIVINKDASITVTEKITVYANQRGIQHGIMRWLPEKSSWLSANRIKKIAVNDIPSPYHTENSDGRFAIYIGDKSTYLDPGIYIYTIEYEIKNAILFLQDRDELYWNITGNYWKFPIENAKTSITLPENLSVTHYAAYTGPLGDQGKNYLVTNNASNQISFTTTKPLLPGDGLTIAIGFQKGTVIPPSFLEQLLIQYKQDPVASRVFHLSIILLLYYLIVWFCIGKDLKPGVIIPLFQPPLNLSPASIRFITQFGFDIKTFAAAIISMAAKGFLLIKESNPYELIKKSDNMDSLSIGEKTIAKKLFAKNSSFIISKNYASEIVVAKDALKNTLRAEYENTYFKNNAAYLIPGLLLSLLAVAAIILSTHNRGTAAFFCVWILIWTHGCYFIVLKAAHDIKYFFKIPSISTAWSALKSTVFCIPFLFAEIVVLFFFSSIISLVNLSFLLVMTFINVLFYHLLKAPTMQGRKILDQIEGFKLFLSTTERYRFDELHPPNKTPELFEKFLPYAIALDVENQWSEQFNTLLTNAGTPYQPSWYIGTTPFSTQSFSSFSNQISEGISNSLSTSSSASSGGGSSGGGGGGGGGGGW